MLCLWRVVWRNWLSSFIFIAFVLRSIWSLFLISGVSQCVVPVAGVVVFFAFVWVARDWKAADRTFVKCVAKVLSFCFCDCVGMLVMCCLSLMLFSLSEVRRGLCIESESSCLRVVEFQSVLKDSGVPQDQVVGVGVCCFNWVL